MTTSVLFYVNGQLVGSKASTGTKTDTVNMSNFGAGTNELTVEALVKAGDPQFAVDRWFVYDTRPDFQIVSIALNPTIPYVGGTFSAAVTVTNAGYTAGNAGTLSIWTNQPVGLVIGYGATKSAAVGTLGAHTGKAITFSGISAGNVDSLGRTFRAFVNSTLSSPETLVNNNQATLVYNVVSKPDLVVSSVTLSPATPARGGVFTATVAVKNQGRTSSANCNIAAWANQPAVPTDDTGKDIEFPLGTLNVNQTVTNVFPNLSVSTGTVKRTFRVFVDCGNVLDEVSKANNQQTVVYTPKSCPDFTIAAVNFSPTNPIVNSNFTAYVTVRNKGYVSGSGGYLDVWANNTNQLVASPTNQGDKYIAVGTIAVNTNKTYTLTGLSAGSTTNQRTFQAYVDSRGTVEETNEINNTLTVPYAPLP
jgi:subtilase family serine protease